MRLAFLCQGKANPNAASRDEVVHPTGWYPASGINGPRNLLEKGTLTHRQWEKFYVKWDGTVGDIGQELCFPAGVSHCPSKNSSGQTGKGCRMAADTETHCRDTAKPENGKGLLWPRER